MYLLDRSDCLLVLPALIIIGSWRCARRQFNAVKTLLTLSYIAYFSLLISINLFPLAIIPNWEGEYSFSFQSFFYSRLFLLIQGRASDGTEVHAVTYFITGVLAYLPYGLLGGLLDPLRPTSLFARDGLLLGACLSLAQIAICAYARMYLHAPNIDYVVFALVGSTFGSCLARWFAGLDMWAGGCQNA